MKRRAFLKQALIAGGLLSASGLSIGRAAGNQSAEATAGRAIEGHGTAAKKIDAWSHFSTLRLLDFLEEKSGKRPHLFRALFTNTPTLINVDARLRLMAKCGIDISVLVPLPWLETDPTVHGDPALCAEAARLFNDDLARIMAPYSDRFPRVALIPTTNPDVMMAEFERAIRDLKCVGAEVAVGPTVKRPDHPDYEILYRRAEELDVPLWLHPSRPPDYPDYVDEKVSKFQVWQALSWLMDSSTAMVRLVFSGVYDRHPGLKLVIHHHGALIPLFAKRMQVGWDYFEQNTGVKQPTTISRPYIEHFKKFYCDTATQGNEPLLLRLAYNFFGPERLLFGSDAPMDPKNGEMFTMDAIASLDALDIPEADRRKIYSGNALRLLKRT